MAKNNFSAEKIANNMTSSMLIHPGEMIKDEIVARGLTQKDLAQQMGVSYTVFNEILNGKRLVTTELQHAEDEAGQIIHVVLGEDSQDRSYFLTLSIKLIFFEGDAQCQNLIISKQSYSKSVLFLLVLTQGC